MLEDWNCDLMVDWKLFDKERILRIVVVVITLALHNMCIFNSSFGYEDD